MPSLRDTQLAFARSLLAAPAEDPVLGQILADHFAPRERLQVYRNNLYISLREALAAVYPAVQSLVGEAFFAATARAFIGEHPPRSGNLHDFGAELATFLAEFPPAASLPYLEDVARIEWAWHENFHAAEAQRFDFAALARIAPEDYGRLRLTLQPAARLVASEFPALRIWEVNRPGYAGDQRVDLGLGPQRALVARVAGEVVVQALGEGTFELLRAALLGRRLAAAAAAASQSEPSYDLNSDLQRLVRQQIIVELKP